MWSNPFVDIDVSTSDRRQRGRYCAAADSQLNYEVSDEGYPDSGTQEDCDAG